MKILGIDLETNGLDLRDSKILEVACAVWDSESNRIMRSYSTVVYGDLPPIPPELTAIHGLTNKNLQRNGVTTSEALLLVAGYFDGVDAICAHNALNFDKPLIERDFEKHLILAPKKVWIDTQVDVEYPSHMTSKRLVHLAVDHGFHNPFAHQAIFDITTMFKVLSHYDISIVLERAKSPLISVRAIAPRDKNPEIKKRRYKWNPDKQIWWKNIRQFDFEKEQNEAPFAVEKI